jgi:hypothetical protein
MHEAAVRPVPMLRLLLLLLGSTSLLACAHTPRTTVAAQVPELPKDRTALVLPVRFESASAQVDNGCWLILTAAEGADTYQITLRTGKELYVTELPEGRYRVKLFQGGGTRWRLTRKQWPVFQVRPGKLNVACGVSLDVDGYLDLKSKLVNRRQSLDDTRELLGRISEPRDQLVSAYTGHPITADLVADTVHWDWGAKHWSVEPKRPAFDRQDAAARAWWPDLDPCYDGEELVNALWLGNLPVTARYEGGELVAADLRDGGSTFTPHFAECVRAQLRQFHPPGKERLEYRLEL